MNDYGGNLWCMWSTRRTMHLPRNCQGATTSNLIHRPKEIRKIVTKVEGIDDVAIDINELAKLLKNKCAAGGTVKGRIIELQGDHKKKAANVLRNNGFNVEVR